MLEWLWQGFGLAVFALIAYGIWMGAFHRILIESVSLPSGRFVYLRLQASDYASIRRQSEAVEGWLESQGLRERLSMQVYRYAGEAHQVGYWLPEGPKLGRLPPGFHCRVLPPRTAIGARFPWRSAASYAVAMTRIPPALYRATGRPPTAGAELQVEIRGSEMLISLLALD